MWRRRRLEGADRILDATARAVRTQRRPLNLRSDKRAPWHHFERLSSDQIRWPDFEASLSCVSFDQREGISRDRELFMRSGPLLSVSVSPRQFWTLPREPQELRSSGSWRH